MWIEIEALDTLFFKDGKPFSMGEETWADGVFPPPPSVFYGAIRSAYMSQINQSVNLANEAGDKSKNLVIENYCLSVKNYFYFPMPLDLVVKKQRSIKEKFIERESNDYQVYRLYLKDNTYISSSPQLSYLLTLNEEIESLENGYIDETDLKNYLEGGSGPFTAKKIDKLVILEPKIGIGRNNITKTTQESKLYRVGMRRLDTLKSIVQIKNLDDFEPTGLLKLGGETKIAKYQYIAFEDFEQPNQIQNRFKIYLATPALLKNGWLPGWIDEKNFIGYYPKTKIKVKLIATIIGKPIPIGGFDMKKKRPKTMLQAVPSGSVYYFEIIDQVSENDINKIKPTRLCEYPEKINEGYGISYIGVVK
jgi:CRISPR-associated protein Cmr3